MTNRLRTLDLEPSFRNEAYKHLLKAWQLDLLRLQLSVVREGARVIINCEGMDAAGKGGAIRRLVQRLDPRSFKVYRIGPPEKWEQSRHYLYRFWMRVPAPGEIVIFDRSWYGRVLVERVEGLAGEAEWQRAYQEINEFERWLTDDGVIMASLWFHIDADTQLKRFEKRMNSPFKRWKMTDEDWRNRKRWDDYIAAAEEMFERTDNAYSPWHVIPANSKKYARLAALKAVVDTIADRTPPATLENIGLERPEIG